MPNTGRRPGFAQKAKPRRFISEILFTDDFQSHRASQIDVERFVSDPHRTATQLDRFAIFARYQLVVLKSFWWLVGCRLDRLLERRLARLNTASKTLAKHADRTELHCSAERCELGQHSSWLLFSCCASDSSIELTLAHQIAFQHNFPAARVPRHRRLREAFRARPDLKTEAKKRMFS